METQVSFQMKVILKRRYTLFSVLQEGTLPAITHHTTYEPKVLHTDLQKMRCDLLLPAVLYWFVLTVCLSEPGFTSLH